MGHTHDPEEIVFGDSQNNYRIPALLYIEKWKKFLAFAESRTSPADQDAKDLVMRTGTRDTVGVKWSSMKVLTKATKDNYRTMNPCPVFETSSETLFLFFICIEGHTAEISLQPCQTRLCYITTQDEHLGDDSWRELKDLTDDIIVVEKENNKKLSEYKTFAVGPGHGVEAKRGSSVRTGETSTGSDGARLLIPAYVKISDDKSYSLVLYSDDGGQSWEAGQQLRKHLSGECQVAQIQGTELYCNARSSCRRVEAVSDDAGAQFTKYLDSSLKDSCHGCQGSVLAVPDQGSSNTWLLYSHPTQRKRRDLGVRRREASLQGAWGKPLVIHPGNSGYSDLAQCEEEGRFACLMECREAKNLQIVFKEFSLCEIPKPKCSPCCLL
ncbi:sialidase-3-like isoform X2 [Sardina pilchardus]|uniref:sialidase-3-like isoform X2 n=1 Tax=Sardina pilchardus TaxID=27697 RepID=UPI002E114BFB